MKALEVSHLKRKLSVKGLNFCKTNRWIIACSRQNVWMLKCLNKYSNYPFWLLYDTKTIWNCWKCHSTSPSSSLSVLIPVTGFEMVVLYLEWQQCTLSFVHGFLWTPQRPGFVPNSYQSAEGQLVKDAPGQVHPWCDTLEADGIESVIPVKHLCHRSFIKTFCWWILLSQTYFWLVANPLGSWQVQLSEPCTLQCYHLSK